ncbi:MAG TPA: hypothetical protein VK456_16030 [Xanthobacteraceae bacterium]|nr:hypothetical protein [Xanthobacteraceae bacterium]
MSLAFRLPVLPASSTKSPRQGRTAAAIRQAARPALSGARRVYRAVLVVGMFAVLLVVTIALRLLIWLPLFHAHLWTALTVVE